MMRSLIFHVLPSGSFFDNINLVVWKNKKTSAEIIYINALWACIAASPKCTLLIKNLKLMKKPILTKNPTYINLCMNQKYAAASCLQWQRYDYFRLLPKISAVSSSTCCD